MTQVTEPTLRGVKDKYEYLIRASVDDVRDLLSIIGLLPSRTLRTHHTARGLWVCFFRNEAVDAETVLGHLHGMKIDSYPVLSLRPNADLTLRLADAHEDIDCVYRFAHRAFAQCISAKAAVRVSREFSHVLVKDQRRVPVSSENGASTYSG